MKPQPMLKWAFPALFFCFLSMGAFAQKPAAVLKPKLKLQIETNGGTNGSSVTWNPKTKLYYAVIAGNEVFPFEAFDKKGNAKFQSNAGIDTRGIWYNDVTEHIEANGAGSLGYFEMKIGQTGKPLGSAKVIASGMNQPDFQSVGTYDPVEQTVVFYHNGMISTYDAETGDGIANQKLDITNYEGYNSTSVICTGYENMPYGLLNVAKNRVDYFTYEGDLVASSDLPDDAVTRDFFWFAFANKHIFLYDSDTRTWTGYKAF